MNTQQQPALLSSIDASGIAWITLNRIEKSNAFDADLITQLIEAIQLFSTHKAIRCLVLKANGNHFSAGADLHWMRSIAQQSQRENLNDAAQLARLLQCLDRFPYPTLAYVNGCAYGGALGLICCCDIVYSSANAQFCLSEVTLGLVPATICPYVCRAMGVRQARRYMLSAEMIDAPKAVQLGVVHEVSELDQLSKLARRISQHCSDGLYQTKKLIHHCDQHAIDSKLISDTSRLIADVRASDQAKEGINAFFSKREPNWQRGEEDE